MQIFTHVTQSITKKVNPLFKWKHKSRFFNSFEKKAKHGKTKYQTHVIVSIISFINALDKEKKWKIGWCNVWSAGTVDRTICFKHWQGRSVPVLSNTLDRSTDGY